MKSFGYFSIQNKTENTDNKSKIDYRFKIIYCIGILSVIASHCNRKSSIELNIQGWFNYRSFHMPLFTFAAGYFFKRKNIQNTFEYILKKFKRLIIPIYFYNFFYVLYIQFLINFGFKYNIKPFNFRTLLFSPLGGGGVRNVYPSWFSSSLFFIETYNIIKRKATSFFFGIQEPLYFVIDFVLAYFSVIFSNKGYNKYFLNICILRTIHLNIYYAFGILYRKHLEILIKIIRNDIYFLTIFLLKLIFHMYYSDEISFYYGGSQYYNYPPFIVIIISIFGIFFWVRISEIIEPSIGKSFYVNIIADNTYSIMINHIFALDLVRAILAFISKNTKYCKNYDFNKFYSLKASYIFLPNNVLQSGIIYFLSCLIIPIMIQKIINKIKRNLFVLKLCLKRKYFY